MDGRVVPPPGVRHGGKPAIPFGGKGGGVSVDESTVSIKGFERREGDKSMNRSTRLYGTTGSIDSIPSHLYNTSNLRPGLVGVDLLVELVPSPAVPHLRAKSLVENQTPHGHAACD